MDLADQNQLLRISTERARNVIFIRNLRLEAKIGVFDWEKATPQPIVLDIELGLASCDACNSDQLSQTIDYGEVIQFVRGFVNTHQFQLVEAMAEAMATSLRSKFSMSELSISITKIAPFPGVEVGIVVRR